MDTHKRTIMKSITWRIIATTTTILSVYILTKNWSISLTSGLFANALKAVFYYIHERAWNKTNFGVVSIPIEK